MLRGRKYLPSSHTGISIHLLPPRCRRPPQRTRRPLINGWIDIPYVQGSCTRRSRSKDQERASLLGGRLSRAYIEITPSPPRSTGNVVVCVRVHAHARIADAPTRATTYAWEYHYLSCVFSVNCHYRRNLVTGCVPP